MGNELDVEVDGQHDVLAVFLCQRGQVDMHARHVDALARAQHAVVLHLCHNLRAVDANDQQVEGTIIEQDMTAFVHVGSEVAVGDVDHVVGGLHLRPSEDFHHVASLILNRLGAGGSAHLRALCVDEDANMVAHLTNIVYNLSDTLLCGMSCIHANYIHSSVEKGTYKLCVASSITNRCNDFGLFHTIFLPYYLINSGAKVMIFSEIRLECLFLFYKRQQKIFYVISCPRLRRR